MKIGRQFMEAEATQELEGRWVGKEKKRYDFVLKLIEQKSTTRGFKVYRMKDRHDNVFIAFDGRNEWQIEKELPGIKYTLETGDCFSCKATVNRHDIGEVYGSAEGPLGSRYKQTVLNRIKLNKIIAVAKQA